MGMHKFDVFDVDGDGVDDLVSGYRAPVTFERGVVWLPGFGNGSFGEATPISPLWTGNSPAVIKGGDINGDGRQDILVGRGFSSSSFWVPSLGGGSFGPPSYFPTSSYPNDACLIDMDGDSDLDIVVVSDVSFHNVVMVRNLGSGSFSSPIPLASGQRVEYVECLDVDSDGDVDVVVAGDQGAILAWFENTDGLGSLGQIRTIVDDGTRFDDVRAGDIDGNATPDLATVAGESLIVYRNVDGNGNFDTGTTLLSGGDGSYRSLGLGDLDGDGDLDLVSAMFGQDLFPWIRNQDGKGTFSGPITLLKHPPGDSPDRVRLFDVNHDGMLDILYVDGSLEGNTDGVNVILNQNKNSDREFAPRQTITSALDQPLGVCAADLDGDGDLDLIAASRNDDRLTWFQNTDGAGSYGVLTPLATLERAWLVIAADFDTDGDMDVLGVSDSDGVMVWYENLLGTGEQWLAHPIDPYDTGDIGHPVVTDVDGDGDVDLVIPWEDANVVTWHNNTDGKGSFAPAIILNADMVNPIAVSAHDFNNDGTLDLVSVHYANGPPGGRIALYYGLGQGTFAAPYTILSTSHDDLEAVAGGDLDSNSFVDLVVADGSRLFWFRNINGTSFVYAGILPIERDVWRIDVVDWNNDGWLDIITRGRDTVIIITNLGGGTFAPAGSTGVDDVDTTEGIAVADLDGDGDQDIVSVGRSDGSVGIHMQRSRNAFFIYQPTSRPYRSLATDSPHCGAPHSFACLEYNIHTMSRCVKDTLVLDPGVYACKSDRHALVSHAMTLAAPTPGSAVFDCQDSGVLYHVTTNPNPSVSSSGDLTLQNIAIQNMGVATSSNTGSPGLRVEGRGASLSLQRVTISGSQAKIPASGTSLLDLGMGGAVLGADSAVLHIQDSEIDHCSAAAHGGALYVRGDAHLVLSNVTLKSSTAQLSGGAVGVGPSGRVTAHHVWMNDNSALGTSGGGGGMWVSPSAATVDLEDVQFVSNTAPSGAGGGLLVEGEEASRVTCRACNMEANTALLGGGVALFGARTLESHTNAQTFFDIPQSPTDPSLSPGATTSLSDAALVLNGTQVEQNTALVLGGGIYICGARLGMVGEDLTLTSNVADSGSSGDGFVCSSSSSSSSSSSATTYSRSSLPWIHAGDSGVEETLLSAEFHGPPGAVVWDKEPGAEYAAGDVVRGQVAVKDVFGQVVVYTGAQLSVRVAAGQDESNDDDGLQVLVGTKSGTVVIEGAVSETPPLLLVVASETTAMPAALKLRVIPVVGGEGEGEGTGYAVPVLEADLVVRACQGEGEGGVLGPQGFGVVCGACGVGTKSEPGVSFAPCVPLGECPANAFRVVANSSADPCICVPGAWSPSGETDVACVPCPTGGSCEGGVAKPTASPGFFPGNGEGSLFLSCPNAGACVGNGQCQTGYRNRLCGQCSDGYYRLRGSCFKCKTGVNVVVVLLFVMGALVVSGALMGFNLSDGMRYKFAAVMIGLSGLQISGHYGRLELDWGPVAAVWFDVVGFVNLNLELTSPECSLAPGVDAWVLKWVLALLLPLFAAVCLGLAAVVCVFLVKAKVGVLGGKSVVQVGSAFGRAWFQSLVLLYLPLTSAAFSVFGCRKDESGRWVLDADPVRSCYNRAWWAGLFPVGLVAVLVYAMAIPLGVLGVLRSRRRTMDQIGFALRFGFLVGRFRDAECYFETVIMARKLLVVGCMTFFFTDEGKANGAVFALMGSMIHLVYVRPYQSVFHNVLAIVVMSATTCVLYAGTFDDFLLRRVGVVGGIVVNAVAIVVGNGIDLWRMAVAEKAMEENAFFQAGDDMDMAVVDHASIGSFTDGVRMEEMEGCVVGASVATVGVITSTPQSA